MNGNDIFIKSIEPGTAVIGRFRTSMDGEMETGFFIRDDSGAIDSVPDAPNISLKAVMFEKEGVALVGVLIRIQGIDRTFDTWWNFYSDSIKQNFDDIISQDYLLVHIYSANKREKIIKVGNSLKEPFVKFKQKILEIGAWTTDQFVFVHKKVRGEYKTAQMMWDILSISKENSKQYYSNN